MYIMNGFVYGGEPAASIEISSVKVLDDMIMLVSFSTGEKRLFDATILQGEVFEPLKKEDVFKNPVIDHGVVTWDDGNIDCAPEFMYDNSYEYSMVIQIPIQQNFAKISKALNTILDSVSPKFNRSYLVIADEQGLQMPQREPFQIDIAFAVDEFDFFS